MMIALDVPTNSTSPLTPCSSDTSSSDPSLKPLPSLNLEACDTSNFNPLALPLQSIPVFPALPFPHIPALCFPPIPTSSPVISSSAPPSFFPRICLMNSGSLEVVPQLQNPIAIPIKSDLPPHPLPKLPNLPKLEEKYKPTSFSPTESFSLQQAAIQVQYLLHESFADCSPPNIPRSSGTKVGGGAGTQFFCAYCGKGFAKKYNRTVHINNVHKKQYRFQCSICCQRFPLKQTLRAHKLRHAGEKPHSCGLCGVGFTEKKNLKRHQRSAHNRICEQCPKKFISKSALQRHISSCHGEGHGGKCTTEKKENSEWHFHEENVPENVNLKCEEIDVPDFDPKLLLALREDCMKGVQL